MPVSAESRTGIARVFKSRTGIARVFKSGTGIARVFKSGTGIARGDLAACRALLRGGSRTFFAASLLLPARVHEPAAALYAFCRLADDAVDLETDAPEAAVARLRDRLNRAYAGNPMPSPADRAFAATVARFDIPRALPEALIEGFAWDAAGRRYETLADVTAYAARVAGTVGAMMTLVMGVGSPDIVARACDLGMAMQLSNIARDVGEDARAGRLYLPRAWLRDAGIDPESWLKHPVFSPALGTVIARLLAEADRLYARAAPGIAGLPAACRPGIRAAGLLYAEIGHEVSRAGCDSVSRRARVPVTRKLRLVAGGLIAHDRGPADLPAAAADQVRFLIDAVRGREAKPATVNGAATIPGWRRGGKIAWLVDLFERLEREDGLRRSRASARPSHRSQRMGRLQSGRTDAWRTASET